MFTIGSDPEVFLTKGLQYVSAIPYTKGTKKKPEKLPNGGIVSYDNVALEFGTVPSVDIDEFVGNMECTLQDLVDYLPDDIRISIVPSIHFSKKELKHKDAKAFGCDADFNAWTSHRNVISSDAADDTFRTAGAHVHIGNIEGHYDFLLKNRGKLQTIQAMDIFSGTASTAIDCDPAALARKSLYGKAGCYRSTSYGVEYRTLSNFWIKSPTYTKLIYSLTEDALKLVKNNQLDDLTMALGGPEMIQSIITEGDDHAAKMIMDHVIFGYMSSRSRNLMYDAQDLSVVHFENEWNIRFFPKDNANA
jgi:hypothetical protein